MIKFDLESYVNSTVTQDIEKSIFNSVEKFTKINDSTLAKIATKIKQSQEENLKQGKDIYGNAVAPKKKDNGKPIFVNSGELLNSVQEQKVNNNEYNIFISANRSEIAGYLIQGTANMTARKFFGISDQLSKQIDNIIQEDFRSMK